MRWPWHRPAADEYDDWYDEDEWDDEDEYLTEWSLKVRQTNPATILKNITESRVVDMDSAITLLDPDTSQFETILSQLARAASPAAQITWLEDELMPRLKGWADGLPWMDWSWTDLVEVVPISVARTDMLRNGDLLRFDDRILYYDGRRFWRFEVLK